MRDFTKSMLSLSWAMSLFGLKQMADLFSPGSNTTASFEAVTRCTEEQLGPTTRSAFRAGDTLQRGLVDLTFMFLTFGLWQPGGGRGWGGQGGWNQGGMGQGSWGQGGMGQGSWGQGDMGQGGSSGMGTGGMGSGCSCSSGTGAGVSGAAQAAGDMTAQAMGAGMDMMQQGVNMAYQILGGGSGQQQQQNTGWGPVPPPSGGGWRTYGGDEGQ